MRRAAGLVLILLACAAVLRAQGTVGGYFSLDYLRGQAAGLAPYGSVENIQAGLILSGAWTQKLGYVLEVRSKENMRFDIEQAWARVSWSEAFQIKLGLFLVPFGRYNSANRPFETPLVQMPVPAAAAFPASWRELGAMAEGKTGFLRYAAWIGNGLAEGRDFASGQQFRDNNENKAWGGRLGVMLQESFEVGGSISRGKISAADDRALSMTGVDATWVNGGLTLTGEYFRSEIANPEPYAAGKAEGWFVLGSYDLGGIDAVVGYQKLVYSDGFHGSGFAGPAQAGLGISENLRVWSFGLTAPLAAGFVLKAEYDLNREPGLELKNDVFRAQIAARF